MFAWSLLDRVNGVLSIRNGGWKKGPVTHYRYPNTLAPVITSTIRPRM